MESNAGEVIPQPRRHSSHRYRYKMQHRLNFDRAPVVGSYLYMFIDTCRCGSRAELESNSPGPNNQTKLSGNCVSGRREARNNDEEQEPGAGAGAGADRKQC